MQGHDSFVGCAIDPFNHTGTLSGVPDRFSGMSIVAESRTIKDVQISDTSKWTYFLITPQIGINLWCLATTSEQDMMSTNQASWISVDPSLKGEFQDQMQEFRTISLAVKVIYTGPPAIAQGTVTVARVPLVTDSVNERTFTLESSVLQEIDDAGELVVTTYTDPLTQLLDFSLTLTDMLSQPDSVSLPLAKGIYATSTRIGSESWDFQPAATFPAYPVATFKDMSTQASIKSDSVFAVTQTAQGKLGSQFPPVDKQWYALLVAINTGTNSYFGNPSFRVEVRYCAEYVPSIAKNSALLRSIARPSPKHKPSSLNQIANIQRHLPAAIPSSESWWEWIARNAGRAAMRFAGGALMDIVQPINVAMGALGLGASNNYPALTY